MSDSTIGMPKCSYCGNYHNYSAEMCKDMMMKPGFIQITATPVGKAHYTVEDVRAAFVECLDWLVNKATVTNVSIEMAQAEALRRWPEEDSHDK